MQPSDNVANGSPRDWERARGLWMLDHNCAILMARAPVEEVAGAIAEDAEVWDRDVLGRSVVLRPNSVFAFRLRGHRWSIVVNRFLARTPFNVKGYEWERRLSRRLDQPVILYGVSDTCGSIGYTLIEDGEVVEDFFAEEGKNAHPAPEGSYLNSTRRDVSLGRVGNAYEFVDTIFLEQDAFDPGIDFDYFFDHDPPKTGDLGLVKNPGFVSVAGTDWKEYLSIPEIEQVDYLVFNSE